MSTFKLSHHHLPLLILFLQILLFISTLASAWTTVSKQSSHHQDDISNHLAYDRAITSLPLGPPLPSPSQSPMSPTETLPPMYPPLRVPRVARAHIKPPLVLLDCIIQPHSTNRGCRHVLPTSTAPDQGFLDLPPLADPSAEFSGEPSADKAEPSKEPSADFSIEPSAEPSLALSPEPSVQPSAEPVSPSNPDTQPSPVRNSPPLSLSDEGLVPADHDRDLYGYDPQSISDASPSWMASSSTPSTSLSPSSSSHSVDEFYDYAYDPVPIAQPRQASNDVRMSPWPSETVRPSKSAVPALTRVPSFSPVPGDGMLYDDYLYASFSPSAKPMTVVTPRVEPVDGGRGREIRARIGAGAGAGVGDAEREGEGKTTTPRRADRRSDKTGDGVAGGQCIVVLGASGMNDSCGRGLVCETRLLAGGLSVLPGTCRSRQARPRCGLDVCTDGGGGMACVMQVDNEVERQLVYTTCWTWGLSEWGPDCRQVRCATRCDGTAVVDNHGVAYCNRCLLQVTACVTAFDVFGRK